jgi:hypothetical protein
MKILEIVDCERSVGRMTFFFSSGAGPVRGPVFDRTMGGTTSMSRSSGTGVLSDRLHSDNGYI